MQSNKLSSQLSLYRRLQQWSPDAAGTTLTFSKRLARENGWSHGYARRVVEEYKKFVFLAAYAGHPVTPAEAVDQAWHLHLTYTQSYWEDLCENILQRKIHHNPTQGGKSEDAKYHNWYERTLQSYRQFFGTHPPTDIWLPAAQRFAGTSRHQWVDKSQVWLIRKPYMSSKTIFRAIAVLFAGCVLWGCTRANDVATVVFGIFFAVTAIIVTAWVLLVRNSRKQVRPKKNRHSGDLSSTHTSSDNSYYNNGDSSPSEVAIAAGFAGFAGGLFGGGGAGGDYEAASEQKTTADSVDSSDSNDSGSNNSSHDSSSSDSSGNDSSGCSSSGCGSGGD